ncbi:MAG: hypothetical protein HC857_05100 [Synechococcales cyanobacterium RU_4_20]|nr:hypothetical protein [Synechococcales cyanobacterium RU_4_20]NJR67790.1 hypothetical protein [Synechococcales cyanobacterium CRU_2_2]
MIQERFYSLLKQRFQQEMEVRPPLFPWETEIVEYEDIVSFSAEIAAWEPQLQQLQLPVPLPAAVLATLFQRCQELVRTTVRDGRRLVQAVESLFAVEPLSLDELAGSMMLGEARSGEALATRFFGSNLPESYETAQPQQQMTLAMIAAYEMLNRLTLKLTEHDPCMSQSWETVAGTLHLKAEKVDRMLRIEAKLPDSGRVTVLQEASRTQTQRQGAGLVSLLVDQVEPNQTYQVQVELLGAESPLGFAVQV